MVDPSRRRIILEASERLLHRYGPAKTTIADIAREAEIAVGSVYLEFPSKEAILEELSSSKHERVLEAMRAAAAVDRPFGERVRALFDARVDAFFEVGDGGPHACDLLHCESAPIQSAHERFRARELALLCDLLRAGGRAGELEVSRAEATARAVLAAYGRFVPPMLFLSPRDETRALLRSVHDVVLYGLVRRKKR